MKKIIILSLLAISTLASQAQSQIVSSRSQRIETTTVRTEHTSHIFLDLGVGAFTGDYDDSGVGVDLGFRWNQMFTPNIGWDILKINCQTDTKNFTECIDIQAKTGVRGVSPVLFGNCTAYANAAVGYGYWTDPSEGGVAWEVGAGLNITPRFAVGVFYNASNFSIEDRYGDDVSVNVGLVGLRISVGL